MTVNILDNQNPTCVLTSPINGDEYELGEPIQVEAYATDLGSIDYVEFYTTGGGLFHTDYTAPYTAVLNTGASSPIANYVFYAVAYDNDQLNTQSEIITIGYLGNTPPVCEITSPDNGNNYVQGQTINVSATATDFDGIEYVEFHNGGGLFYTDYTAPYEASMPGSPLSPIGDYNLYAIAYDNTQLSSQSETITVHMLAAETPLVEITSPTLSDQYYQGETILVSAEASGTNGIDYVEFYNGNGLYSTDYSYPYTANMPGSPTLSPVGYYSFYAKVYDNSQLSSQSETVTIHVVGNQAPVCALISPNNGAQYYQGETIYVSANATDDHSVEYVEFYIDNNLYSTDYTAPYEASVPTSTSTAIGDYTFYAIAYDDGDGQKHSYSSTITASLLVGSVSNPPVASFSANQTTINEGETITFTDLSTNTPTSWDWNFGDGSTNSTSQNPTHTYTTAGIYTVSLTATNSDGYDTETKTDYITVVNPPVANFSANQTVINEGETVIFTDLSTNTPTSWDWSFGDGSTNSTSQNPTHIYTTTGTYTVSLTATNLDGSDNETKIDYITVDIFTQLSSATINDEISLYPNPVNSLLTITGVEKNAEITVFDICGKQILSKKLQNNTIDLSELQSGVYVINIISSDLNVNYRIVKE